MYLPGQAPRDPSRAERRVSECGYAMAALLTMIAVMSIILSAALPVWRHEMRREREAELVFRGEQYARAVGLFNRKYRTYPPNLDVLVQQKFLRKKYKDPITGKDFRPIYVGGIAARQASGAAAPPGVQRTQQQQPQQQQQQAQQAQQAQPALQAGVRPGGGLMGVASTSEDTSIRIYKGRTKYHQWEFVFAQAAARPGPAGMPGRPGGPGQSRPGMPSRPGGPGGLGRPGTGRPGGPGMNPGGTIFSPTNPGTRPPAGTRPPGGR
jgi:hypothetical protein